MMRSDRPAALRPSPFFADLRGNEIRPPGTGAPTFTAAAASAGQAPAGDEFMDGVHAGWREMTKMDRRDSRCARRTLLPLPARDATIPSPGATPYTLSNR